MANHNRKIVGLCFDHMHMGDQLTAARDCGGYEIVGVYDSDTNRMNEVCDDIKISPDLRYDNWEALLDETKPEIAIVCSSTSDHPLWAERLAERGIHIIMEKPFATSATEAKRAIKAAKKGNVQLVINWPLAWYPSHRTSMSLIEKGVIGTVQEVHYYDGNRGPQYHLHAKKKVDAPTDINDMWWFKPEAGGGSLLDYLGYGTTLATWFRSGELPSEITAESWAPEGYGVDLQSIAIARYPSGLSTFQTRWGTFTDPWVTQPQPFCGFVIKGDKGTITSRDYSESVSVQTTKHPKAHDMPVDRFKGRSNIFEVLKSCLDEGKDFTGPCSAACSLGGQYMIDAAFESQHERRPVALETVIKGQSYDE